ncbi:MAG: hypothetical protein DLM53_09635 [Candidatus Eremiobacter antarcticus]|nr:hypothetical protein [Candidatus Eremiobacteraeota bacterium]PZR61473.1 MAG: hypothetical protein DLM53_09635 [Candidatus Eremiobacter sp. RRmetagenome_bin22]
MEPNEYIQTFFDQIKAQMVETKVERDGLKARYKNLVVAASWSNQLWEVQLHNDKGEPIMRQYDPFNARSSQAAANYFVDALRTALGQEPLPRPPVVNRNFRSNRGAAKPAAAAEPAKVTT